MDGAPQNPNLNITEFQAYENCTNSIFASHAVFSGVFVCFNKSLYSFPIFLAKSKCRMTQDLYIIDLQKKTVVIMMMQSGILGKDCI